MLTFSMLILHSKHISCKYMLNRSLQKSVECGVVLSVSIPVLLCLPDRYDDDNAHGRVDPRDFPASVRTYLL